MFKNIMRSLGYVPSAVATDLNNDNARLERMLDACRKDLNAVCSARDKYRAEVIESERIRDTMVKTVEDYKEAAERYVRRVDQLKEKVRELSVGACLVSVYVSSIPSTKKHKLMLAGYTKDGNTVTVPVRELLANKANRKTLMEAGDEIALAFGIVNTTMPEALSAPAK